MIKIASGKINGLFLLAVLIIIVVAVFVFYRTQVNPSTTIPADFKLERGSTGGIDGGGDRHDLSITALGILTQDTNQKTLVKTDMEALVGQIEAMNFFNLDSMYPPRPVCSDAYLVTITITMNARTKAVSYEDCLQKNIPARLLELSASLLKLAD